MLQMSILTSCGGAEDVQSKLLEPTQTVGDRNLYLVPNAPTRLAFERSASNLDMIEPVPRVIDLGDYDQILEPDLSSDRTKVNTAVVGVGLEAQHQDLSLPIRLGIRARQWDPNTRSFGGEARIFKPQGLNLDNAIEVSITSPTNPNILLSGLGLKLREGRFTKLELKRVSLASVTEGQSNSGDELSASTRVELPAGWAAIGILVAIDRVNSTQPLRSPFVSDFIVYTANVANAGN